MFDDIEEEIGRRKPLEHVKYSFQDYLLASLQEKDEHPSLRMGQAYVNVLHRIKPEMETYIRSFTSLDCFYDDAKIGGFLYEVCATWEDYE